jgi:hypothetical protein
MTIDWTGLKLQNSQTKQKNEKQRWKLPGIFHTKFWLSQQTEPVGTEETVFSGKKEMYYGTRPL